MDEMSVQQPPIVTSAADNSTGKSTPRRVRPVKKKVAAAAPKPGPDDDTRERGSLDVLA
jgi:hypothetical protein